jgi:signal transduction histidine kinase
MGGFVPITPIGWVASASSLQSEATALIIGELIGDSVAFLVVVALAVLGAILIVRRIVDPIGRLEEHALAVARGDLTHRVEGGGLLELAALAAAFNRMAEEIRVREQERDEYVHMISHDLRVPLTVIQGQAQLLQRVLGRAGLAAREGRSVEAIITSSQRMNAMIQDLVDRARMESGQLTLERTAVDLHAFLLELKDRLAGTLDVSRLVIDAPPDLPRVFSDPNRLDRILMNLLTNSFKYSDPGTEIRVSLSRRERQVATTVSDIGPGISPEELPHLFERYRRTRTARETREGLGLGLYISRVLVDAMGGRIWVETEVGKGSCFCFTLPSAR